MLDTKGTEAQTNLSLSASFLSVHWAYPRASLSSPPRTQFWPARLSESPWCWPTQWWAPPSRSGRTGHWAARPTDPGRCTRSGWLWSTPRWGSERQKWVRAHESSTTTLTHAAEVSTDLHISTECSWCTGSVFHQKTHPQTSGGKSLSKLFTKEIQTFPNTRLRWSVWSLANWNKLWLIIMMMMMRKNCLLHLQSDPSDWAMPVALRPGHCSWASEVQ